MKKVGLLALPLYLLMVPFANWLIVHFGAVPVGFGLKAPAAVYAAGAALVLRDFVQRAFGRTVAVVAILGGAALSVFVAPSFALASGAAFLASEGADFVTFTALEGRSFVGAMLASNVVGLVVDSLLFLWLAFGSLAFFWGQVVGKAWMGVAAVLALAMLRRTVTALA